MEEFDLFQKLDRVQAPSDFEDRVLHLLENRRRSRTRSRILRFSFAGAFSAALLVLLVLNFWILPKGSVPETARFEKAVTTQGERGIRPGHAPVIPIIEPVDYSGEIRSIHQDSKTIYILEKCTDRINRDIKY